MTATKKEIEEEVARLSSVIDRQTHHARQIIDRAEIYLKSNDALNQWIDRSKPTLKRQGLKIEILSLKAQLSLLEYIIKWKQEKEERKAQKEGGEEDG